MPTPREQSNDSSIVGSVWRLAATMLVLTGAVLAVFFWQGQAPEAMRGDQSAEAGALIPRVVFEDITASAGIQFVHENGAAGEKLLPETMGGGVAFFDFDNDGDQDLLFVNGCRWPWDDSRVGDAPATAVLYRNDSTGRSGIRFTDVTAGSGLDMELYGMGVAIGDVNADGWLDVYLTAVGPNQLFLNLGNGTFENATEASGVAGAPKDWGTSATFFDYDLDGDLDLFVCNYVEWNRELDIKLNFQLAGIGRAYGPPHGFEGAFPMLYRNDGHGFFEDVSAESGVQIGSASSNAPLAKSLGVSPVDVDGDGWMDLVVANDTVQNFVFLNQRDGTFRELGASSGIAFDANGATRGAMGIDTAFPTDVDQLAIAIGNYANENTALYLAQSDPLIFSDEALRRGIGEDTRASLTFGVFFFDYDLDGREDLLTVNGHIEPEISRVDATQRYRQQPQLFWNWKPAGGGSRYVLAGPGQTGPDLAAPVAGRGSAFADMDNDGDWDLVIAQVGAPARLLENQLNPEHWARLELRGKLGNTRGIGARITIPGRGMQAVVATRGYLSVSDPAILIPLPPDGEKMVTIRWPNASSKQQSALLKPGRNTVAFTE